jgi:hypothetical protein
MARGVQGSVSVALGPGLPQQHWRAVRAHFRGGAPSCSLGKAAGLPIWCHPRKKARKAHLHGHTGGSSQVVERADS